MPPTQSKVPAQNPIVYGLFIPDQPPGPPFHPLLSGGPSAPINFDNPGEISISLLLLDFFEVFTLERRISMGFPEVTSDSIGCLLLSECRHPPLVHMIDCW